MFSALSVCLCVTSVFVSGRRKREPEVKEGAAQLYTKGLLIPSIWARLLVWILNMICINHVALQQVSNSRHNLAFIITLHFQTKRCLHACLYHFLLLRLAVSVLHKLFRLCLLYKKHGFRNNWKALRQATSPMSAVQVGLIKRGQSVLF